MNARLITGVEMGEVIRRSSQRSRSAFDPVCRWRDGVAVVSAVAHWHGQQTGSAKPWAAQNVTQVCGANIMVVSADQTAGQPPLEPTH
ncbi:hypothetical protein HDE79_002606 [Rhodanobacter sp. MP1X3]|nr:hypothetical protein [Rhodanobacter sp. MP1X3]